MATRLLLSELRRYQLHRSFGKGSLNPRVSYFSSNFEEPRGRNPGLDSVISQGIQSLERSAAEIQAKTRKISLALNATGANAASKQGPNPRQLSEGQRIMDIGQDCLENLCEKGIGNMYLGGEPIIILDVQVNANAKQAKVFWTLPYGILTDPRMTKSAYQKLMLKLREIVEDKGGGKLLARQVHSQLRAYYPPRLKLVPATDEMVAQTITEYMQ